MPSKMKDLGEEMNHGGMIGENPYKIYPRVMLSNMKLPELDKHDVDTPVKLTFEGYITRKEVMKHEKESHIMVDIELRRGSIASKFDSE